MTTRTVTSSTGSQMHNNIMAAGSRDRPPMLATGRYSQWCSWFLRYIDTRPNGIPEHTTVETPMNLSPANKAHFEAKKEAIHLILTGIGDEIYSTVDACQTAQEIWEAIERFYKLMNEMIRANLTVATMQVIVRFLQQLQQEWSRYKGKEIAKPIKPPYETASEKDSDPEQAQRDKDMQNKLALIAKYFKKIYKPTNNNVRTFSNSRNKNVDTTQWYKNDNQSGQFRNQRTVNVAEARENVGSPVVQQSGIQCFNCKEFGHFSKECRKPKRVKDSAYHKEKMLLCKQAEQGVPLQAEQYDWLADTDEEIDEQELEAHYNYMEKIQEVPTANSCTDSEPLEQVQNDVGYNEFVNDLQHSEQSESISNTCLLETDDSNVILDSPNICEDDIQNEQNDVKSDDERVALASLKLDTQNDSFIFVHELKQEMHADLKYVESLEKEIDELESDKAGFSNMYDTILQECVSHDVMCSYFLSLFDLDALAELQCLYLYKVKECDCLAQKLSKQTESVSKEVNNELLKHFAKVEKHLISLEIALQKCKEQVKMT
uniref:CCHC-type domain-containing protein n=1 Tax=Tanacetum cinerariifolium TaxID=118510 RepID=A0A6L2P546_TANCI|nr:hypothetical protein [Tanacetum cinerariifolium]